MNLYLNKFHVHYDRGEYAQALVYIRTYLAEHPDDQRAQLSHGVLLRDMKNYNGAFEVMLAESAVPTPKSNKKFRFAYYTELGSLYKDMGDYESAATAYQFALDANPKITRIKIKIADCLIRLSRYTAARRLLSDITKGKKDRARALLELARLEIGQGNFSKAEAYARQAAEASRKNEAIEKVLQDILDAAALQSKS